jgi:hypothetical protein
MLQTVHPLHLGGLRINPIDLFIAAQVGEGFLVFGA